MKDLFGSKSHPRGAAFLTTPQVQFARSASNTDHLRLMRNLKPNGKISERLVRDAVASSAKNVLAMYLLLMALAMITLVRAPAQVARAGAAEAFTTTTMTLTMGGESVTSVSQYHAVRLTATVKVGSSALTLGQVKFCDATAKYCEDNHLLSLQQLTKAGKAEFRFVPGPGTHSYKAIFVGTNTYESSSSDTLPLEVTSALDPSLTRTDISASGSNGSYTLTAAVSGGVEKLPVVPTGLVYFSDRSESPHALLGQAKLPTWLPAVNFTGTSTAFADPSSIVLEGGSSGVVGDFNGDGIPDMVFCNDFKSLIVMVGNGRGGFTQLPSASHAQPCGFDPSVADLNMDGIPDLITGGNVYYGCGDGTVYPRCGAGQFMAPAVLPVPPTCGLAAVADLNHDGIPDFVGYLNTDSTSDVCVVLGNADGTYTAGWHSSDQLVGGGFNIFGVGDFNGDGIPDFVANYTEYGVYSGVAVFFGSPDATFTETDILQGQVGQGNYGVAVADVNGDGRTDIFSDSEYTGEYGGIIFGPGPFVNLGKSDKTFSSGTSSNGFDVGYGFGTGFVADFNGDGILDVTGVECPETTTGLCKQLVFLGQGDGSFLQASSVPVPTATTLGLTSAYPHFYYFFGPSAAIDFNGDGLADLPAIAQPAKDQPPAFGALLSLAGQNASAGIAAPSSPGAHQVVARYQGDDNFTTSVSAEIALTGLTTPAPVARLSSTFLLFGDQTIKTRSDAQTVVLTNTGTAAFTISNIGITEYIPPYALVPFATSNDCPASLAPTASCRIRVRFYPFSVGIKQSQLAITDNAADSPQLITLTGTAVEAP